MADASSIPSELLVGGSPVILVFLPNTNELQRFVLPGAFSALAETHRIQYVLPAADAQKMWDAATPLVTPDNSSLLDVPADRFKRWVEVFQAGCEHYAHLSPSFAIRAGLDVDPDWERHWDRPPEERAALDEAFDQKAAALLEGIEPLPAIVDLFDRFRPVYCIVPTSLLDLFCNEVVLACDAEDVTCVLLQSGWDNLSSKGLLFSRTPYIGCWGRQSARHAEIVQRMPSRRLELLGAPHYEFLRAATDAEVAELREELGIGAEERMLLFGGSFRQFDETSVLRELDVAIDRGRLPAMKIVYRPHPWRAARQHEDSFFGASWKHVVFDPDMRDRYVREREDAGYIKRNVPMFDMQYLSRLISAADAVISPMSTLLVEAMLLDKPTMAIAFGDGKHRHDPSVTSQMTHFAGLRESEALRWCETPELLVKQVAWMLRRPSDRERPRARLLPQLVTREPGTYAQRLEVFCRTRVEPTARKQRGRRTGVKRETISHAYGAHLIAREYCGLDEDVAVPGYWMHGWIPAYHNIDPALIALHKKEGQFEGYDFEAQIRAEKADTIQWVSRTDQAEYLRAHGYRHVRAIGLPIAYLPPADVARVPGSLLVMPPHSHKTHGPDDPLAEAYAEAIADLRNRFEHIWVGVNEDDMAKRQWVESFRRRGIHVFTTTDQADPRTLVRLRQLLSTFEYVTTNGYGSHIALAAYCGAKVSVFGPYAEFPYDRMKVTHAVKMFPSLLDRAYELCTEPALRRHYPFLFVDPDRAAAAREWGAAEVGESCRVSPGELRRLFGWTPARLDDARRASQVAVPAVPAPGGASQSSAGRPLVLFGMAHQGFFRNFERVIARIRQAGVDVHVHFSKAHQTISMADYDVAADASMGRLTLSTSASGASDPPAGAERARIARDLLLYSRAPFTAAADLQDRFFSLQKAGLLPVPAQRFAAWALKRCPEAWKDAMDARLAARDEAIAPCRAATELIDSLRPSVVVVTPLVNFASREVDLVKAARQRGILTVLAAASWDNLTNKGRIKGDPDRVAVWNAAMAREAVELHGVGADRVWTAGAAVLDPSFEYAPTRTRADFCRELGLDEERAVLVYVCSSESIAGTSEYSIVKEWLRRIRVSEDAAVRKANVLVRPHPMTEGWEKLCGVVEGQEHGEWRRAVIWPLRPKHPTTADTRASFFDSLLYADAVVGLNTSAMLEAAIMSKPVLTFLDHERAASQTGNLHFQHLAASGAMSIAATLDEHSAQLSQALREPERAAAACARFVESFLRPYGRDIEASETLADMLLLEAGITARMQPAEDSEPIAEGRPA